jgi:hypothetical protein
MTRIEGAYNHLILAVTDFSRGELRSLATQPVDARVPSEALIDDLSRTLAGHTQIGRTIPLSEVVTGPIPRDATTTRICDPLLTWIRTSSAA